MTAAEFWDGVAPRYARLPIRDPEAYSQTLDRVRSYMRSEHWVLELGCGTGTTALRLADAVHHITASDYSAKMISIARQRQQEQKIDNVDFVQAEALDRKRADGQFDCVMAFNLLHLLPDVDATLTHVASLLKPNGLFISKTPCLGDSKLWIRCLVPLMQAIGKAPQLTYLRTAALEERIRHAGFELIETGDYPKSLPSHLVVARKL